MAQTWPPRHGQRKSVCQVSACTGLQARLLRIGVKGRIPTPLAASRAAQPLVKLEPDGLLQGVALHKSDIATSDSGHLRPAAALWKLPSGHAFLYESSLDA